MEYRRRNRFDFGAQLFCKVHICPEPFHILLIHGGEVRGFHKQGGKGAAESACHPGSGADDFGVGGGGGEAYQNMLVCVVIAVAFDPCGFG